MASELKSVLNAAGIFKRLMHGDERGAFEMVRAGILSDPSNKDTYPIEYRAATAPDLVTGSAISCPWGWNFACLSGHPTPMLRYILGIANACYPEDPMLHGVSLENLDGQVQFMKQVTEAVSKLPPGFFHTDTRIALFSLVSLCVSFRELYEHDEHDECCIAEFARLTFAIVMKLPGMVLDVSMQRAGDDKDKCVEEAIRIHQAAFVGQSVQEIVTLGLESRCLEWKNQRGKGGQSN